MISAKSFVNTLSSLWNEGLAGRSWKTWERGEKPELTGIIIYFKAKICVKTFSVCSVYFLKVSLPEAFALYIDADLKKDEVNIMSWNFSQFIVPSSIFSSILGDY